METEYLKTLWMLRFQKVKKSEEDAAWDYQEVLDRLRGALGEKDEAVILLSQLIHDERMHARLADELIQICYRNHPEVGLL